MGINIHYYNINIDSIYIVFEWRKDSEKLIKIKRETWKKLRYVFFFPTCFHFFHFYALNDSFWPPWPTSKPFVNSYSSKVFTIFETKSLHTYYSMRKWSTFRDEPRRMMKSYWTVHKHNSACDWGRNLR